MSNSKIKLCLMFSYFIFAILLNCVGTIILEVINHYHISKSLAGNLDAYKDITIAIFSFMIASFLPRIGYKKSMLLGLALVTCACIVLPVVNHFWMIRVFLVCVGIGFALIKVSVYSTIALITENEQQHAAFTSKLEGVFMCGVLSGFWIFGFFIHYQIWLDTFWFLALLGVLAFLLLVTTPLKESSITHNKRPLSQDFNAMLSLMRKALVIIFIVSVFAYVFIEQGLSTWLPTFNHKTLHLSAAMSVEMSSILAAAYAVGRLAAGYLLKYVNWSKLLIICLAGATCMVILLTPHSNGTQHGTITSWGHAPWRAYAFPLIGIFLAPIYPTICSTLLSAFPKSYHSAVMGLIMIFSALGGTLGSKLTGVTFTLAGGEHALQLSIIPIIILIMLMVPYKKLRTALMNE